MQKFLILAGALVVVGGVAWLATIANKGNEVPGPVACTADAMQCPDGSYVGRTGPHCEFVCPAATTTLPTGGEGEGLVKYNSGIRGTVMAGPTCPVERDPPDPRCADKPLFTLVAIYRASDLVHAVVLTRSNTDGTFQASLPPGEYVVGAGESMLPRCTQTPATVAPVGYTSVVVNCDTGIR